MMDIDVYICEEIHEIHLLELPIEIIIVVVVVVFVCLSWTTSQFCCIMEVTCLSIEVLLT